MVGRLVMTARQPVDPDPSGAAWTCQTNSFCKPSQTPDCFMMAAIQDGRVNRTGFAEMTADDMRRRTPMDAHILTLTCTNPCYTPDRQLPRRLPFTEEHPLIIQR